MNPPRDTKPASTNTKNGALLQAVPVANPPANKPALAMKQVTLQLSDDVHRKLRMVALSKGATTSALVESYVNKALTHDLALVIAKLSGE